MKKYIVRTADSVNEHALHCSFDEKNLPIFGRRGVSEYATDTLDDAMRVYKLERAYLQAEDRRAEITNPHFDFVQHEPTSAVYCEVVTIDEDSVIELVVNSEYFFIK